MTSGTFKIELEREYHVGAGHGRGAALDDALFRDGDGTPAIRSVHGALRQAAYELLQLDPFDDWRRCGRSGLNGSYDREVYCEDDEAPVCPMCRIFGSPALPSPWSIPTMRLPVAADAGRPVRRASMDLARRRPRDRTLFAEELGPGAHLELRLESEESGEEADFELAFLWAALRTLPAIGAGRRRGHGQLRAELVEPGHSLDKMLDLFERGWLARKPGDGPTLAAIRNARTAAPTPAEGIAPTIWSSPNSNQYRAYRLVVRTREPVIAAGRTLTGNVLMSEDFIPGSLLLGAFAGRAANAGVGESEFLEAFRSGHAMFPDLIPAAESEESYALTVPAPLDLWTCPEDPGAKPYGHGVWSSLLADPSQRTCPECGEEVRLRRLEGVARPGPVPDMMVSPVQETKIDVAPDSGRVEGESLYHREAIPTGTLLWGELLCTDRALGVLASAGLAGTEGTLSLRIGKRHRRGYGLIDLHWEASAPPDEEERRRSEARIRHFVEVRKRVPLVLRSRLMMRDGTGRWLQRLTGADLGLDVAGPCAVRTEEVGGFWRHMGMPRTRGLAIAPGSVLMLHTDRLDKDQVDALVNRLMAMEAGVAFGERTAEGMGRFAVAPFPYDRVEDLSVPEDESRRDPDLPDSLKAGVVHSQRFPARSKRADYDIALKAFETFHEDWRVLVRLLHTRAGQTSAELLGAVLGGGDPVVSLWKAEHPDLRSGRPAPSNIEEFLTGSPRGTRVPLLPSRPRESSREAAVIALIKSAAGAADADTRRAATMVLAAAIADRIKPEEDG